MRRFRGQPATERVGAIARIGRATFVGFIAAAVSLAPSRGRLRTSSWRFRSVERARRSTAMRRDVEARPLMPVAVGEGAPLPAIRPPRVGAICTTDATAITDVDKIIVCDYKPIGASSVCGAPVPARRRERDDLQSFVTAQQIIAGVRRRRLPRRVTGMARRDEQRYRPGHLRSPVRAAGERRQLPFGVICGCGRCMCRRHRRCR